MDISAMRTFLSEDNIRLHKDHVKTLRSRLSIIQKSCPEILGLSLSKLLKISLKRDIKREAIELMIRIKSHECFFSSFSVQVKSCPEIKRYYSSCEAFMYELLCHAKSSRSEFVFVYKPTRREIKIKDMKEGFDAFIGEEPVLALDIAEHTYFLDYQFKRDEYLRRATSHLAISKLFV